MKWTVPVAMILVAIMGTRIANADSKIVRQPAAAVQSSVISDTVKKIREDDEGLVVLFAKNTGSYYLKRNVVEYDRLRKKLEESMNGKKNVNVSADSSLHILEVK